jgi:hypothetical protein
MFKIALRLKQKETVMIYHLSADIKEKEYVLP